MPSSSKGAGRGKGSVQQNMGEADERSPLTDKSLIKVVLAKLNFKCRNGSGSGRIEESEIGELKFFPPPHLFFVNCAFKKPTSIKGGEEDFIPFHIDQRFVSHREEPHKYSGFGEGGATKTTIMN